MKIYKYAQDFGRMGDLQSVFVADDDDIARLREAKRVYLGEVLGKHSEIKADINDETLKVIECSDDAIAFINREFNGVIGVDLLAALD